MFSQIEKIRQKPEHIRRVWQIGISALITLVIALVWGVVSFTDFNQGDNSLIAIGTKDNQASIASPMESLKYQFSGIKEAITDIFK
jgi:hypothetical protein